LRRRVIKSSRKVVLPEPGGPVINIWGRSRIVSRMDWRIPSCPKRRPLKSGILLEGWGFGLGLCMGLYGPKGQRARRTKGQKDKGPEGQRARRTKGPKDKGPEGQRARRTKGPKDKGPEGQRARRTKGPKDKGPIQSPSKHWLWQKAR